jgi:hypothetical protein
VPYRTPLVTVPGITATYQGKCNCTINASHCLHISYAEKNLTHDETLVNKNTLVLEIDHTHTYVNVNELYVSISNRRMKLGINWISV